MCVGPMAEFMVDVAGMCVSPMAEFMVDVAVMCVGPMACISHGLANMGWFSCLAWARWEQ